MYESVLGFKKPIVGLDIGYQTLKVMELRGENEGARLYGVAEINIAPKTLDKGGVRDKQKVAQSIVAAMQSAKPHPITAKIVSSALPESLVFTKSIDLPNMKIEEVNKNIPYQASECFPFPANDMYMDWQVVGTLSNKSQIDVFVVATPKAIVDSLAETIRMAGLELSSLETKPLATARALINNTDRGPYIILDIGAKTSSIICYDEGIIKLTSTLEVGGDDLTTNFKAGIESMAAELAHLVKYYQNRIGQATIFRQILLAGGGANIPRVLEAVGEASRIKTEIRWPIIKTKTYNPKFAAVIGLAMKRI